jgi:curved DNA-binding protein CbpA
MTNDKTLTETTNNWRSQVEELQKLLAVVQVELIDAETGLAEKLAAINAFEFKLRALTSRLVARLDKLDKEIEALRQKLRWLDNEWGDAAGGPWSVDDVEEVATGSGAQAAGEYRYRQSAPETAPLELDEKEGVELKKLYRQLARRFHPDLGLTAVDREYRTRLMMAINAAYAAHDLDKLRQLALEPDSVNELELADSDQRLAEALLRELDRCRRRLQEIKVEMANLEKHKSARLMRQVELAQAEGRDWQEEILEQIQEQINRKLVERDVLQQEVDFHSGTESKVAGDAFADAVWDFTLDFAYDEDPDVEAEQYYNRRRDRFSYEEDILDDSD